MEDEVLLLASELDSNTQLNIAINQKEHFDQVFDMKAQDFRKHLGRLTPSNLHQLRAYILALQTKFTNF